MNDIIVKISRILITAALPVLEVRGSIPLGIIVYNIHPVIVFIVSFLGNIIPALPLLLFFRKLESFLIKIDWIRRIYIKYINNLRVRSKKYIEKYGFWGLSLFVAIPLPSTGVWTGALVAYIFGMNVKKAFKALVLGSFTASTIVTLLTLTLNITLSMM